jgi:hypothetical protein
VSAALGVLFVSVFPVLGINPLRIVSKKVTDYSSGRKKLQNSLYCYSSIFFLWGISQAVFVPRQQASER